MPPARVTATRAAKQARRAVRCMAENNNKNNTIEKHKKN
jgi:hypothetical protein